MLTTWLQKWARVYSLATSRTDLRQIPEGTFAVYAEALEDLTPEQLDAACHRVTQVCRFFPTPADIRAQIDRANTGGFQLEAEQAWQEVLTWVNLYVLPDIGIARGAPTLPPAVEHAAKAAGDVRYLECCSEEELGWRKKDFIRDYSTIHETGQVEHLLTRGEARCILAQLSKPPEPKRLPAPQSSEPPTNRPEPSEQEVLADFAVLGQKLDMQPAVEHQGVSDEEWERRKREQKKGFKDWLAQHPEAEQSARSEPTVESRT